MLKFISYLVYVNFLFPYIALVVSANVLFQFDRSIDSIISPIISIPLSVTSREHFATVKRATFSPSLQTIKGCRNYFKRLLRGSGAVADYYVSPTTAPFFSTLMRESLCSVCKHFSRDYLIHFYLIRTFFT